MTDLEFDVLDELYFVTSYSELKANTAISDEQLALTLTSLVEKGWVKVYRTMEEELETLPEDFHTAVADFHFLASKKGLLKHNSR